MDQTSIGRGTDAMTCDELLKALSDYVDDATVVDIYKEFGSHMAGCNPCTVVVDNIKKTIQLFQEGQPYPMPQAFSDRLRTALKARWDAKFAKKG